MNDLPYRTRLWRQAIGETRRYWNSHRTITAISSPIITALFWEIVKGWRGWWDLLYAVLLGFVIFFVGWAIAFLVSLARAPAQLDDACHKEILRLTEQLGMPDKAQEDHLRSLLAKLNEDGLAVLRVALFHDEVKYKTMQAAGLSNEVIERGTRNALDSGLLNWRNDGGRGSAFWWQYDVYWVSPEIRPLVRRLLHTTDAGAPSQFL